MNRMGRFAAAAAGVATLAGLLTACATDYGQKKVMSVSFTPSGQSKKTALAATDSSKDGAITVPAGQQGTLLFTLDPPSQDNKDEACWITWLELAALTPVDSTKDRIIMKYKLPSALRTGTTTATINCKRPAANGGSDTWYYVVHITAAPTTLYWASTAGLGRSNLDGADRQDDFVERANIRSVAVNSTHVYYGGSGSIWRSKLDGTAAEKVTDHQDGVVNIAVDDQHVFWTDAGGRVHRTGPAGGNPTVLTPGAALCSIPSALAAQGDMVYFTNICKGTILRVPVAGGDVIQVVEVGSPLTLTTDSRHLYWGGQGSKGIYRSDLSGKNVTRFIPDAYGDLGLTTSHEHLYWLDGTTIGRARLDGTDVQPAFLSTGPTSDYYSLLATGPGTSISGPVFTAKPNPADFGTLEVGRSTSLLVEVTNSGDEPLAFTPNGVNVGPGPEFWWDAYTCALTITTLQPGETCSVAVSFRPASAGPRQGLLTISGPNGKTYTVPLAGRGAPATVKIAPDPLAFGDQQVGTTSAARSVTVQVKGGSTTIGASTIRGGDGQFTVVPGLDSCNGVSLQAGGGCQVAVTFQPKAAGAQTATLVVPEQNGTEHTATLTGNGVAVPAPVFSAEPATLDFGDQPTTVTWNPQVLTVRNIGTAPMIIDHFEITGADAKSFDVVTEDCNGNTLAPSATCGVQLVFIPTDGRLGPYTAGLTFYDDAAGSPQTVPVRGNSVLPPS